MGFRIDKGIFQFKDGEEFVNKFKIAEDGNMVEVDRDGNAVTAYMKIGDKATDSDLLDGINSSSFHRSNGGTYSIGSGNHFSLKHTTSTGFSEFNLANNSGHQLVMGSIGSAYTNSAWAGSRYIYSSAGELRIKAATNLRLYSGGMSHTGNLAVTFDTSRNATFEGNVTFKGVLGNDLRVDRHIDGSRGWSGGSKEMFLGWYSDKLVIGNNDHGGHDYALAAPLDSIIMTNPTYYHKSIGLGKNTVIPYAEWGATNASTGFVVIEFPVTAYAMINADIGVYEYNGYNGSNIMVGGHPWNGGWYNYGSKTLGELGKTIRFAYTSAGKYAIVLGLPDTKWTYGQVQLKRIQNGTYYDGRVPANGEYKIYQSQDEGIFAWISGDTSESIDVNRAAYADNSNLLDGIDSSGFLRSTAKAADSNLLDGIDSSSFLRSDVADTAYGNITLKYNTDNTEGYEAIMFAPYNDAAGLNDYIIKASSSRGVFGRKSFGWHVHSSSAFGVYSNGWKKLFGVEGDTGNAFATGSFNANQLTVSGSTNSGRLYADEWGIKIGTSSGHIQFGPANNDWAHIYTDRPNFYFNKNIYVSGAKLATQTYASDLVGGVNTRIDNEIRPAIDTAQSTADSAVTAAAAAQATADVAETRANGAKQSAADALAAAEAAQTTADGKLGATAKAADSNLLDGVDSSRFVYGGNATKTTNVSNVSTALASGFYDSYNATGSPANSWYTYINMRHNNTNNNYGSQIAVSFYSNADMYVRTISNGTYQGWSKIWNSANFDPSTKASTGDVAGVDARITDEVLPQISTNADNIARNAADIATKAAAGGSYSQDFVADDMYVDQWFRNTASGKGLYNEATTQHWYSDGDDYWNIAGGGSFNAIRFRDEHAGTQRGLVGADSTNRIGFLDAGGNWAVRHDNDSGTLFYTDNETLEFRVGRDKVTGNYGTVQTDTTKSSWGGYSIAGRVVFMHDHSNGWGIYNDVNNEWMIYGTLNGQVELRYNAVKKLETTSGGVTVTGTVSATAFSGSGANLTNLPIPDQRTPATINREPAGVIVSVNFNLDRGQIEFKLDDGQVINGAIAR